MIRLANVTADGSKLIVVEGTRSQRDLEWVLCYVRPFGGPHGSDPLLDFSIEAMVTAMYAPPPKGAQNVSALHVFRVLMALAEHADEHGRGACPSQRALAEMLGLDRRTVRNALAVLVERGSIVKVADAIPRVRGDTYDIVLPALNSDGESPPKTEGTRAGNSGGELGRGTRTGIARHEPEPDPLQPSSTDGSGITLAEFVAEVRAAIRDPDRWRNLSDPTRRIVASMGYSSAVRQIEERYLDHRLREAWRADQMSQAPRRPGRRRDEEAT
jgi:hypothetical protein